VTTTTQPTDAPARRSRRNNRFLNRTLKRLHFFAGILCAPLILVAALTGLLYAFAPTVEEVVHDDLLTASASEGPTVPVSDQVAAAHQEFPDLPLAGVRLGEQDDTTRILFEDADLPASTTRAVFVDPYTGDVAGVSTQYGSSGSLPFRQWLSDGHRTLWLGEPGRIYSELAASWLGVLAVGGVVMWWSRHRSSPRRMLRTGGRGRTRTMRQHGATGTVVAVGMVFLTVTGLTWSSVAGSNIGELRSALSWQEPSVSAAIPGVDVTEPGGDSGDGADDAHADHAGHSDHGSGSAAADGGLIRGLGGGAVDRVSETALEELDAPVTLTAPSADGEAWTAEEARVPYRLSNDAVSVDWATGQVTDRLDFADWPLAAQASAWLIQLHMGTLFGLPNQIVLGLLAAAIVAMVVWGYAMWFRRRPSGKALASAPPRASGGSTDGSGSKAPGAGTVALAPALVVYGVIAPLFGVTCLVFIVLSELWSRWRQRSRSPRGRVIRSPR
jgi:uncharacterized iron-regulated membrane protein